MSLNLHPAPPSLACDPAPLGLPVQRPVPTTAQAEAVADRLADEHSRTILAARLQMNHTHDPMCMMDLVDQGLVQLKEPFSWQRLLDQLAALAPSCQLVIYGAGGEGDALRWIVQSQLGVQVHSFCDRNSALSATKDLPVEHPLEVVAAYHQGRPVRFLLGSEMYADQMRTLLLAHGVSPEHILGGSADLSVQYLEPGLVHLRADEVVVDAGALELETTQAFAEVMQRHYGPEHRGQFYAFEPDPANLARAHQLVQAGRRPACTLVPLGLWSHQTRLGFLATSNGSSTIAAQAADSIEVTDLDSWLQGRAVSFIKMDIEGAEYEALWGARSTITTHRPSLAISVYHRPEDVVIIPELITSLVPDYTLYLRHYSIYPAETVLYALAHPH